LDPSGEDAGNDSKNGQNFENDGYNESLDALFGVPKGWIRHVECMAESITRIDFQKEAVNKGWV
jgi:hypothetical protein